MVTNHNPDGEIDGPAKSVGMPLVPQREEEQYQGIRVYPDWVKTDKERRICDEVDAKYQKWAAQQPKVISVEAHDKAS